MQLLVILIVLLLLVILLVFSPFDFVSKIIAGKNQIMPSLFPVVSLFRIQF